MKIVGLTGSIGMGKSTVAKMFSDKGIPVFDADRAVHALQAPGGLAIPTIDAAFPGTVKDGVLDRQVLRNVVFEDAEKRKILQDIIHPMVAAERKTFLYDSERAHEPFVVMDVPLLFESGGDKSCDLVVVVSAPAHVQRQRVLSRPGMDAPTFEKILAQQMPDHEKRHLADFVIDTGGSLENTERDVDRFISVAVGESENSA